MANVLVQRGASMIGRISTLWRLTYSAGWTRGSKGASTEPDLLGASPILAVMGRVPAPKDSGQRNADVDGSDARAGVTRVASL